MGLIPTACRAEAEVLGLTLVDLGRQVRRGFYGEGTPPSSAWIGGGQ